MHADISAVSAQRLGRDGELDGLQEGVGGGARLRLRRQGPVAEGEEADVFHGVNRVAFGATHSIVMEYFHPVGMSRIDRLYPQTKASSRKTVF